jgi:hypothetical protein
MMLSYKTLWNERIEGASLSSRDYHFLARLFALISEYSGRAAILNKSQAGEAAKVNESQAGGATYARKKANQYLGAAQMELRRVFPTAREYRRALGSGLGTVACDGWFRVYLRGLQESDRQAVLDNLCFNSVRALFEKFLLSGQIRKEFASEACIDPGALSKIFNHLLSPRTDPYRGLTLKSFHQVCKNLCVAPRLIPAGDPREDQRVPDPIAEPVPGAVTARERHLWELAVGVSRALHCSGRLDRNVLIDCHRLVALHVAQLYSIRDPGALNRVSTALMRDLLARPAFERHSRNSGHALATYEPGLRQRGPLLLLSPPDHSNARKFNALLRHTGHAPTILSPPPPHEAPKDLWEQEADRELLKHSQTAWEHSERIYSSLIDSPAFNESTIETWEWLHLDPSWLARASDTGWGVEQDWHVRHCTSCHEKLLEQLGTQSEVNKTTRFRIFRSKQQRDQSASESGPTRAGDPDIVDHLERSTSRRLADGRFPDRTLRYSLDWIGNALEVTVWAEPNRVLFEPQLILCVVPLDGDSKLIQHFLVAKRGYGAELHLGSCRFHRRQLEGQATPRISGDIPLEFSHPMLIHVNRWNCLKAIQESEVRELVDSLAKGYWDESTLPVWKKALNQRDWNRFFSDRVDHMISEPKRTDAIEWYQKVKRRLDWHAVRGVDRFLENRRLERLRQTEERVERRLSYLLGKQPAEVIAQNAWHLWNYLDPKWDADKPTKHPEWFVAQWTHNTEAASWVLLDKNPSIVGKCFRSRAGYMTNDSVVDPHYWTWKPGERTKLASDQTICSALAAPIVRPRLSQVDRSQHDPNTSLGVVIVETDGGGSFHAAQVADLEAEARGLYLDLFAWYDLRKDGACSWQPHLSVHQNSDTYWHMIGLIEESCDAIAHSIADRGVFCSVWYLDWAQNQTFLLASNGYAQEYRIMGRELRQQSTKERMPFVDVVEAWEAGRYEPDGDDVDWNHKLMACFPDLACRGLLQGATMVPIRWGDEGKPNCILIVHRSQFLHAPRYPTDEGYDLKLIPSLKSVSGIPAEGKSLIVVADVKNSLHFRVFDRDGEIIVDTDERKLPNKAEHVRDLRVQLKTSWPPNQRSKSDTNRIIAAALLIVGHTRKGLPSYEELKVLAERLGRLLSAFLVRRKTMARAWVARCLAHELRPLQKDTSPDCFQDIWDRLLGLLKDMFEASGGSIYTYSPIHGIECLATTDEPRTDQRIKLMGEILNEYIPNGMQTLRHYDSRSTLDIAALYHPSNQLATVPFSNTRVLACRILDEKNSRPLLLIDLRRRLQDRPFTEFTEQLLLELAQECHELCKLQQNLLNLEQLAWQGDSAIQDQFGKLRDDPLKKLVFPLLSIPTLAELVLQTLVHKASSAYDLEGVAKLWFQAGPPGSNFLLFREKPDQTVRGSSTGVCQPEIPPPAEGMKQLRRSFFAWVRGHLGRGTLVIDYKPKDQRYDGGDRHAKFEQFVEDAAGYFAAILSKENGQALEPDLVYELLIRPDNAWKRVKQVLELRTREEFDLAYSDPSVEFHDWRKFESTSEPLGNDADEKDKPLFADLDHYGVRIVRSRSRLLIPLYRQGHPRLVLSCPLGERQWSKFTIPKRPCDHISQSVSDLQSIEREHKRSLGEVLERWCGAVGRITGSWHSMILFTPETVFLPVEGGMSTIPEGGHT